MIATFTVSGFSLPQAVSPLRVELFSTYFSAVASPVMIAFRTFVSAPLCRFSRLQV